MIISLFLLNLPTHVTAQDLFSFSAYDVDKGIFIKNINEDHPLIPASTIKLLITHLGYTELGGDHTFTTLIGYRGKINQSGELEGDLIVRGGGDPTLGSRHFDVDPDDVMKSILNFVLKAGINCIRGDIVIDASGWGTDMVAPTWPFHDIGNYYAAGAWPLNFRDNATQLTFQLSGSGAPKLIEHDGPADIRYVNELITGPKGSGDQAYIYGVPFQKLRFIRGSLPRGQGFFQIKGSLPEPPRSFGRDLVNSLVSQGIQVGDLRVNYSKEVDIKAKLGAIHSPKLAEIIRMALLKSDNIYTESIFRYITNTMTYKRSLEQLNGLLQVNYPNSGDLSLYDGSGLSPFNRITVRQFVSALVSISKSTPDFWALVPRIEDTSLSAYLTGENCKVKSGYMENVRGYAGLLGDHIVFAALYNGPHYKTGEVKKKISELLEACRNY